MPDIEKKMQIMLYDEDFNMVSRRLVTQDTEIRNGPKDKHEGPMVVEVCLYDKEDVDIFIQYLKKVQGDLPLEEKIKKRSKMDATPENLRLDIVEALKAENVSTDAFQELLQEYDFVPVSLDFLKDLDYQVVVKKQHRKFVFWVKRTRKAKNPINHKYDAALLIGFRDDKVVVYDGPEEIAKVELKEGSAPVKVPKFVKLKFPPYIAQDERNRLRFEIDALNADPTATPSRYYCRWVWDVQHVNEEIKLPQIDTIPNPYK